MKASSFFRAVKWMAISGALTAVALAGCARQPPIAPVGAAPPPAEGLLGPSLPDFPDLSAPPDAQPSPEPHAAAAVAPPPTPPLRPEPFEDPEPPQFRFVFFRFDRADLDDADRAAVAYDAHLLKVRPHLRVAIEGHCDERGPEAFNVDLGLRRAMAVEQALEANGVPESQVVAVSQGKDDPLELGHTRDAWATNRSAVIREQ
jgi:peptidoglycan-associated lipoprotein